MIPAWDTPRQRLATRTPTSVALAVVVGLAAGAGAVVFRWMIRASHDLLFGAADRFLPALGEWRVAPLPAIGGLIVGLLVFYLAAEARGSGIPEVMLAVAKYGGKIRARVSVVKAFASSMCIGSGGSAGREGPIVQIGASVASTLGQVLRMPRERVRLLAAFGSAAGAAATFNAPIGGSLFASEVILRDFGVRSFSLVVLAAVVATAFSRSAIGDIPAFRVPGHAPSGWGEPSVDGEGPLSGIITLSDLERAARQGLGSRTVGDAATRDLMVCYPDQSLREALAAPSAGEVGRLPVVEPENPRRMLGVLRRSDIIRAYSSGAAGSTSARLRVWPEQP